MMFPPLLHLALLLISCHEFLLSSSTVAAGNVSAIIVFGDSTVDPGNNNYIPSYIKANFPPYGRDFAGGVPTGRFTNGRVVPDFISEAFGLKPYVPAYLGMSHAIEQLATGVSFASGGTGLDDLTAAAVLAIPMDHQLVLFRGYKEKLQAAYGETKADEIVAEALYFISIGNNDVGVDYFILPRRVQFTPEEYFTYLAGLAEASARDLYDLGARKIQLNGILPTGCVPAMRTLNLHAPGECMQEYNQYSKMFNAKLKKVAMKLTGELPGVQVVYSDAYYSVLSAITANPSHYGIENVAKGCCATGLIEASFLCLLGEPLTCQDVNKYLFFDSAHPTERVYKMVAAEMMNTVLKVFR